MQKIKIGKDGPLSSVIGIGAMSFSNFYGPTDEATSHAVLDEAMALDVSHIDTSNVYGMGQSELAIGSYLASRGAAARAHFNIATKAGISRDAEGRRYFDNSLEHLEAELEKSLKRLGIEAVDLFYVHRRNADVPIEQVTENLMALVKKGKTRSIGFSEIAPSSLRRANAVFPIAAVQSEYSLSTRSPELGLVQTCSELGTALVAFSPVGRGILTDNPMQDAKLATLPFLAGNPRFTAPNREANLEITNRFRALASERGVTAAALAIAWLLHRGPHILPIPGTSSVAHFRELVAGTRISLLAEDLAAIDRVLPIGWAHGDRYSADQWVGPERYS